MPIVNCIVSPDFKGEIESKPGLIQRWSKESGVSEAGKEMTINIVRSEAQCGNKYKIVAYLDLPTQWSPDSIISLQRGLGIALTKSFSLTSDEVLIITHVIESGKIFDKGEIVKW